MMRVKWLLIAVAIVIAGYGCGSKESEENAKKAALYDSLQQQVAGKQQKMEACMAQAEKDYQRRSHSSWEQIGCEKYGNPPPMDIVVACNQATDVAKKTRDEDEERCVKLYK